MANTTNQGWSKPTVGGSEDTWGATINTTLDAIDTLVGPVTAAEIAKLDGLTSSTAELNKLTGVTSTPTELNLVAGLTASTAELNHVTGVTSAIQTQINTLTSGKQSVDATLTALSGLATGANKVPYSTGVDTFGQLDLKDEDNMVSDSATAVPSQQSVKAYVDAVPRGLDFQTPVATTSGTFVDFDSIPSTVTQINVYFIDYKASPNVRVQLKVGGTAVTTGYASSSGTSGAESSVTDGFFIYSTSSSQFHRGMMTIHKPASGIWVESHSIGLGGADANGGGTISGLGTVDGIRIKCSSGSFVAGQVSVSWQ